MDISSIPNEWFLYGSGLLIIAFVVNVMFGNPFRHVQHTVYLSGTLGAGKTSYSAILARHYIKKGYKVYSTFALNGAIPFDMSNDSWPKGNRVVIILDEMLRAKKEKFYDAGTLASGLTMARQEGQIVIWLSQSHLSDLKDLDGTFQVFATTKKAIPLGKFGNINFMRFSSDKFRRTTKLKAEGSMFVAVFIPGSIWQDYNSRLIYGLTCDKQLNKYTEEQIESNRIQREAKFRLRKKKADELARREMARILASGEFDDGSDMAAARPHAVQARPRSGGPEGGRAAQRPSWHRPGGARRS